jgi:hypothetical protein
MADPIQGLRWLREATTHDEVVNALWDLRDSAYDRPQSWHALTAETLFQALAETVAEGPADDHDWFVANRLLAKSLEKALALGGQRDVGT